MYGLVSYDISRVKGPLANTFLILINALFFNVNTIGLFDIYPKDFSEQLLNKEYLFDFIVVGSGAAGCAVTKVLIEQDMWTVLLIEAGDYPTPSTEVPGLYHTFTGTKEDWLFKVEKDKKACLATVDHRCSITKGRVLGGTSSINDMRYVRALPETYDRNNVARWSSYVTRTIFEKIESYDGPQNVQYRFGTSGMIHLSMSNYTRHPRELLRSAYRSTGFTPMPRRKFIGLTDHLLTVKNGERFNMAKAFITPMKDNPNFFFTKKTEVSAVVIDAIDRRALGVNVTIDGIELYLRARKEVILAAGAINNAKLLLLSGVGPSAYLKQKKLPVIANIPAVGRNLQLHLTVPIIVGIDPCPNCAKDYYRELDLCNDVSDYVIDRKGNLSTINIKEFAAYIHTRKSGITIPNIGIYHTYFRIGDGALPVWLEKLNWHHKIVRSLLKLNAERTLLVFEVTLLHPLSRGEILLNDTHHQSNPKIIPRFMSDVDDLDYQTLLSGFNFITNMTEDRVMKEYNAAVVKMDIPNCRNYKFCTKQYMKCYIYNMAFTRSDVAGTARMGPECDKEAVVKEDLEIKKVRCLRVADSSVLEGIPMGDTVATDAMIGVNMAEILKEKWLPKYVSPFNPNPPKD